MAETGPTPDTKTCKDCDVAVVWLWSPRVYRGLGGWVMFERVSEDGFTVRSHRCKPPRGEYSYQGSEEPPVEPAESYWRHRRLRPDQPEINERGRALADAILRGTQEES